MCLDSLSLSLEDVLVPVSHSITGDPRATAAEAERETCVTKTAEANEAPDPGDPVALSERANCERERACCSDFSP